MICPIRLRSSEITAENMWIGLITRGIKLIEKMFNLDEMNKIEMFHLLQLGWSLKSCMDSLKIFLSNWQEIDINRHLPLQTISPDKDPRLKAKKQEKAAPCSHRRPLKRAHCRGHRLLDLSRRLYPLPHLVSQSRLSTINRTLSCKHIVQ